MLTLIEICSPEVQQGLANAKRIVQTLTPEVYRIYEATSVKKSSVSMPSILGNISYLRQGQGNDLLGTLTFPVDVTKVVSGLNNPVGIAFKDGLLLIAELGEKRIACCDLTGEYFLTPEKMTIKQLCKALND